MRQLIMYVLGLSIGVLPNAVVWAGPGDETSTPSAEKEAGAPAAAAPESETLSEEARKAKAIEILRRLPEEKVPTEITLPIVPNGQALDLVPGVEQLSNLQQYDITVTVDEETTKQDLINLMLQAIERDLLDPNDALGAILMAQLKAEGKFVPKNMEAMADVKLPHTKLMEKIKELGSEFKIILPQGCSEKQIKDAFNKGQLSNIKLAAESEGLIITFNPKVLTAIKWNIVSKLLEKKIISKDALPSSVRGALIDLEVARAFNQGYEAGHAQMDMAAESALREGEQRQKWMEKYSELPTVEDTADALLRCVDALEFGRIIAQNPLTGGYDVQQEGWGLREPAETEGAEGDFTFFETFTKTMTQHQEAASMTQNPVVQLLQGLRRWERRQQHKDGSATDGNAEQALNGLDRFINDVMGLNQLSLPAFLVEIPEGDTDVNDAEALWEWAQKKDPGQDQGQARYESLLDSLCNFINTGFADVDDETKKTWDLEAVKAYNDAKKARASYTASTFTQAFMSDWTLIYVGGQLMAIEFLLEEAAKGIAALPALLASNDEDLGSVQQALSSAEKATEEMMFFQGLLVKANVWQMTHGENIENEITPALKKDPNYQRPVATFDEWRDLFRRVVKRVRDAGPTETDQEV